MNFFTQSVWRYNGAGCCPKGSALGSGERQVMVVLHRGGPDLSLNLSLEDLSSVAGDSY